MRSVIAIGYVARKNYSLKYLILKATRRGATFNFAPLKVA
jgi:hypothetical protein